MLTHRTNARARQRAASVLIALALFTAQACARTSPAAPLSRAPALYSLSPNAVIVGSPAFTLTVRGDFFTTDSRIRWNEADLPTTFVSSAELRTSISAAMLGAVSTASLSVYTGPPGGGLSGSLDFGVTSLPPLEFNRTSISIPGGTFDATVAPNGVAYFSRIFADSLVRVNVASNTRAATIAVGQWPYEVSFNSTGARAFTTHLQDSTIGVINTASGALTASYFMAGQPIRVRVASADTLLFVTTVDGKLLTLHAATGQALRPATPIGGVLNGLALTPDGTRLWLSNTIGDVQEVSVATGELLRSFAMGGRAQDIVIIGNGSRMYISNESGWIGLYNLATLARIDSIPVPVPFGIALNPTETQLWVASSNAGIVHVFHTLTGETAGTINTGGRPRHIAFTSAGIALISNESSASHIVREIPP